MNGTVDMFDMLKSMPDNDKLDWVLLHINDHFFILNNKSFF